MSTNEDSQASATAGIDALVAGMEEDAAADAAAAAGEEAPVAENSTELSSSTSKDDAPGGDAPDQAMEDAVAADAVPAESVDDGGSSDGKSADGSAKDLPYSTRGRSTGSISEDKSSDRPSAPKDPLFDDQPNKSKDPILGASFLESLSEEERRTRTRIIPEVDGMHALRKHEVKDDLALARSLPTIATSASNVQTRTIRLAGGGRKKDAMVIDGEDAAMLIQDNRTVTIPLPTSDITVPSDAFVAPEGVIVGDAEGTVAVKESSKKDASVSSPSVVESVTAFNPPRPPESVGPKKKHRVIRWERRPEDIEVDMKNYRRTVQRTREELEKSEAEYERMETIDAHLRRHFLNHLELMNDEYKRLHDEMQVEVQQLMKESETVVSRTRSRNLTKVSVVMRDVLNSMKDATPMTDGSPPSAEEIPSTTPPGVGGLNVEAFTDWDRFTTIDPMKPSISWLVPGQKVSTPYGEGVVEAVFAPEQPQPGSPDLEADGAATQAPPQASPEKNGEFQKNSKKAGGVQAVDVPSKISPEQSKYQALKPTRVSVKMPYGVGIFGLESILSMESPAKYTDSELAKRWKGMAESALQVGPIIDFPGMASTLEKPAESDVNEDSMAMDIDDAAKSNVASSGSDVEEEENFVPMGASLFPTKAGRGNYLDKMNIVDVEKGLQDAFYNGFGVLGDKKNPGVTKEIRSWEDDEQEYLTLRASALQLKNILYRQRRIRLLNERTSGSMNDRYQRAEELVSEMRSDLKSLKHRLEEELTELGITEETAVHIFSRYYKDQDEDDHGDASTPKRLRRASSVSREMLAGVDLSTMEGPGDARDSTDDNDLSGDDMEDRPAKKVRTQ
ncbi:MAG: hypothetical protein SGILL_007245 [Bacillariaceae sp.]